MERGAFAYHRPMASPPPILGGLDPQASLPFGRDSVVRVVVAEPVTALLVQRALVMEVAHPKVAAAVAHHSGFQRHPLRRAWVTADAALRLVFGNERVARGAARQIYGVHDRINGRLDAPTGPGPDVDGPAQQYTAHDASLLAWVWATLVDSAETAFTRWVRPLGPAEAQSFYAEMRGFGRFLGIPDAMLPADRPAFSGYLDDMLGDDRLGTSAPSRALARQVLWFEHRVVPSPLVRVHRVLALATLDSRILERLEIRPEPADLDLGRRLDAWLGAYYRRLPRPPRIFPGLYVVLRAPSVGLTRRLRAALGQERGPQWID